MFQRFMEWLLGPEDVAWDEITERTTEGHLSKQEALCIDRGQCPDCGYRIMIGPEGCGSTNVKCSNSECGHVFNMALGFGEGNRIENSIW